MKPTQLNTQAYNELSLERDSELAKIIEDAIADGTFGSSLDSLHEAQLDELVSLLEIQQEEAGASTGKQIPSKVQRTVHKAVKVVSLGFVDPGKKKQAQVEESFTHWDRIRDLLREARATKHKKWEHESDQNSKQTNRIRSLLERQFSGLGKSERIHIGDEMKGPDNDWGIITLDRNAKDLDILSFVQQNLPAAQKIWEGLKKKREELQNDGQSIEAGFNMYVSSKPPVGLEISAMEVFAYLEELKRALIQANFLPKMEGLDLSSKRYDVPTIHVSKSNSCRVETPKGHAGSATIFIDPTKSVAENVAYIRSCLPQLQKHEENIVAQYTQWKSQYEAETKERDAHTQAISAVKNSVFGGLNLDNHYLSRVVFGDEMSGPDAEWGIITINDDLPVEDIRKYLEDHKAEAQRIWGELDHKNDEITRDPECRAAGFELIIPDTLHGGSSLSYAQVHARAKELKTALIAEKLMPHIEGSYYFPSILIADNNSFDEGKYGENTVHASIYVDATQSLAENIAYIRSCQPGLNENAAAIANKNAQWKSQYEAETKERDDRLQSVLSTIESVFKGHYTSDRVRFGDKMSGPDAEWGTITIDGDLPVEDIRKYLEDHKAEALRIWEDIDLKNAEIARDPECRAAGFKLYIPNSLRAGSSLAYAQVHARAKELKAALIAEGLMPNIDDSYNLPAIHIEMENAFYERSRGYVAIYVDATQSLAENIAYIRSCQTSLHDFAKAIANEKAQRRARPE